MRQTIRRGEILHPILKNSRHLSGISRVDSLKKNDFLNPHTFAEGKIILVLVKLDKLRPYHQFITKKLKRAFAHVCKVKCSVNGTRQNLKEKKITIEKLMLFKVKISHLKF